MPRDAIQPRQANTTRPAPQDWRHTARALALALVSMA
jgi:hypothetical protein